MITRAIAMLAGLSGPGIMLVLVLSGCTEEPASHERTAQGHQRLLDRAEQFMQVGRVDDAAPLALELATSNPLDWRVHDLVARVHLRRAITLRTRGLMDESIGQMDEATDAYALAIAADGSIAGLYRSAAETAQVAGRDELAMQWYRRAIELEPEGPRPYLCLAQMHMTDQPETARTLLKQAIGWAPDFAQAHASLAVLAAQSGDSESAHASMDAAVQAAPSDPAIRLAQARMYRLLGSPADGLGVILALDERDRASEAVTWEQAQCWSALGRLDRVADVWTACLAANVHRSDSWRFALHAAQAHRACGNDPAAAVLLEQAEILGAPAEAIEEQGSGIP